MRFGAELPNFFTIQLLNESPTLYHVMIIVMDNGKMNTLGRLEYGAVIRHRNPFLCTISYRAFYLFYRWNITGEALFCFRRREL
jgi:hypothetical protein